jgi:hypothetical protein
VARRCQPQARGAAMSGNSPGLGGVTPTDPHAAAAQLGQSGITGKQPGINAATAGDLYSAASSVITDAQNLNWIHTKGSKLEYGFAGRFEIVLGLKNTLILGLKTALDVACNRTYNLGSYTTRFAGARYEAITPKKIEVVYGKKTDEAWLTKRERVQGAWTHTSAAKERKHQALFKSIVKSLLEEVGGRLEKTIDTYQARWTTLEQRAKTLSEEGEKLSEKFVTLNTAIDKYKTDIEQIEHTCKQFELKSAQLEIAADAAMSIQADKKVIKGSTVSMKAGTIKFMGDLVKLGE